MLSGWLLVVMSSTIENIKITINMNRNIDVGFVVQRNDKYCAAKIGFEQMILHGGENIYLYPYLDIEIAFYIPKAQKCLSCGNCEFLKGHKMPSLSLAKYMANIPNCYSL